MFITATRPTSPSPDETFYRYMFTHWGPKVVAARRVHGTIRALSSYILLPPSTPPWPDLKEIRRRKPSSYATP
jgi:hypothetical protein